MNAYPYNLHLLIIYSASTTAIANNVYYFTFIFIAIHFPFNDTLPLKCHILFHILILFLILFPLTHMLKKLFLMLKKFAFLTTKKVCLLLFYFVF